MTQIYRNIQNMKEKKSEKGGKKEVEIEGEK
jgi:hypothetical protein